MFEHEREKLKEFQELIQYDFKDDELLRQALTTPLLGNETGRTHYDQILETLGDSVIKTIFIIKKYKEGVVDPEVITKTKQAIENDETLTLIAEKYFKLEQYVFKTIYQEISCTRVLADVFEAICGAIFLDSELDISTVESKIIDIFYEDWDLLIKDTKIFNKSILLEYLQKIHKITPIVICEYEKEGLEHELRWRAKNPKIVNSNGDVLYKFNGLESKISKNKAVAERDLYEKIFKKLKT